MSDEVRLARLSQPEAESRLKNSRLAYGFIRGIILIDFF